MIPDPEVRQKNVMKSLTVAKKHIKHAESSIIHSTYGITDDGDHKERLRKAFYEIKDYIDLRLLLEETLPLLEDEPEPEKEYFVCEHGHKHRSERSLRWCNINTEFNAKQQIWLDTPPDPDGTKDEIMDFGEFRALFWSQIAMLIKRRDSFQCQSNSCGKLDPIEVHHIIPRRAGGSDHPANLITYCQKHHVAQGTHGNGNVRGLVDRKLDDFGATLIKDR